MRTRMKTWAALLLTIILIIPAMPAKAWVADNGDGTFTNPVMWGDYPDNDIIRVGDTYYMSSTSMHLFPACPIMSSKDLVNWKYESYALSEEEALRLADNDDGLTLKNGRSVYDMGPWATSLRYSEKLQKFYLLVNMQDGVDAEYAILCVADQASGPWKAYRLDNPQGAIKGLYDPGLLFDKDPVTGEENGDIWVIHGQGSLYVSRLNVVDEETGELALDEEERNIPLYDYTDGGYNEGSHAYKFGDTYYIISTPTWNETSTKKSIAIQTKDLLNGPYEVKDIMRSYMNFGDNGIHQGGIVDVPQEDGTSQWWSVIFQDRGKLGRVPTLQPVYWEEDENGLKWPMLGVQGKNGDQAAVTMEKPNTGAETTPEKPADSDEFDSTTLGNHWQWNHVSDPQKWSLTERPGYMRLHTATVTDSLTTAQNTLRQRVVGPESAATIKMDISGMQDGDVAGLSVIQRNYNYIGVTTDGENKRVLINDNGTEQISAEIPSDTTEIWFKASTPRFEYRTEFSYSLDGENFTRFGGRYEMHYGNYVGMGFGAFNFATKELGGYVDLDYFHMDMPDDHGNYNALNEKIEAERYDLQSYDISRGEPTRDYNPLTTWTADYAYTDALTKSGGAYDLALDNLRDGDWVTYNRVDFGDGADWMNFRVSAVADGDQIEVHVNDENGEILTTVDIPNTGDKETFTNVIIPLENSPKGVQKLCLVYRGEAQSARMNWFMAGNGEEPVKPEVPANLQAKGIGDTKIEFSWDNVDGAKTYDLKIGDELISNVTSPFVKTGLPEGALYKVTVRAKNEGGYSQWSDPVKASGQGNPYKIPQNNISIPKFSSEETGGEGPKSGYISAILDGDDSTFWHSAWSSGNAQPPHWFILDLGKSYEVNKLTMLPRQGSGDLPNGLIQKFTLLYSNTGTEDGDFTPVFEQKELSSGIGMKTVDFEPVTARYLKIYIDESHNNFASLAEINVFRSTPDTTGPEAPANVTTSVRWEGETPAVELKWEAATDEESGIQSYSIFRDGQFLDITDDLQYTDTDVEEGKTYSYEIVAANGAGVDGEAAVAEVTVNTPPKTYQIPQDQMTATASSEETIDEAGTGHGFVTNVLDGNPDTFWCTQWSDKNPDGKHPGPHWLLIDLGKVYTLDHADFLQRNLNTPHGQVTKYNLSYSVDREEYAMLVENGTWDLKDQSNTVQLGNIQARYLKLDCLEGQGTYVPAAMAEVNVYAVEEQPAEPEELSAEVLKYAIDLAKSADTEGVIDSVKTAFEQALADAEQMLADVGAGVSGITQADVDTCWQNLIKAMQYLSFKQGDKTDLEKIVALAADIEGRLDSYLDDGKQAFTDALAAARETLADGDAMQDEVNQAWRGLLEAMANLRLKPDKSALETLINEASALSENAYETESFGVMRTALAKAQEVFADETADQKEVTAAEESLKDAVAKLVPVSEGTKSGEQDTDAAKATADKQANAAGTTATNANADNAGVNSTAKSAKTGDAANPMAAATVMAVAMAAAVLVAWKKREGEKDET